MWLSLFSDTFQVLNELSSLTKVIWMPQPTVPISPMNPIQNEADWIDKFNQAADEVRIMHSSIALIFATQCIISLLLDSGLD